MEQGAARRTHHRIGAALVVAVAMVATVTTWPSAPTDGAEFTLREQNELAKSEAGLPHVDPVGAPFHVHDPRFNNALARGGEVGDAVADPTTKAQAKKGAAYVASQRALPDPKLGKMKMPVRRRVPQNRYAMAGGCYTLRAPAGTLVKKTGPNSVALKRLKAHKALRFRFQATDLGTYLLYVAGRKFLVDSGGVALAKEPSRDAEWTVRRKGKGFTFTLPGGRALKVSGNKLTVGRSGTVFTLKSQNKCLKYPESQVNVKGAPFTGVTPYQEVRGYFDAHNHHMAFEFLGGDVHCGRPWHKYGVAYALVDCPDHSLTAGYGGLLESVTSGTSHHDPVGWPTFKDWPAPHSLTHEGTYYKWVERMWRSGARLFTALLVENNKLCELYPLKHNSCNDLDSVILQAKDLHKFERYVDAQWGGPGKGWYRIVTNPFQARKVINEGKMAVIMGMETSVPFGCTFKSVLGKDIPACDKAQIRRKINRLYKLGIRQMEIVNKFDNALTGVAGDQPEIGVAVNAANFLETGSFWDMQHCEPKDGESADRTALALPDSGMPAQDALFGAIGQLFGGVLPAIPAYGPPLHCNRRGLTGLGKYVIRQMVKKKILFDPDHMSVKARKASLTLIEKLDYSGVLSSHSWSTPDSYPRIYKAGGTIGPMGGNSTDFVSKWRRHLGWADSRYYWGFSFGSDINGLAVQGDPRGNKVANKVTYPFTGLGGVRINRQRTGKRVFDINKDGVAQYGLYADWIQDLAKVAGKKDGPKILDDMSRGAEAMLQTWERALGIKADSCRNPKLRKPLGKVKRLIKRGMSTTQVMRKVGQPYQRLGTEFELCAKTPKKKRVTVTVHFNQRGKVVDVS